MLYLPTDARAFLGQDAISYSEMSTLSQCEKKWKLTYDNEEKQEKRPTPAMELGSEMHRLLGIWWGHGAPLGWDKTENDTAEWLMDRYNEHYMAQAAPLAMLQVEVPFAVKLPWGSYLFGYFDGIVYDHEKDEFWIAEFKTMGNWSKLEQLQVDKQVTMYIWAANQLGMNVKGVMYDAIRTYKWTGKNAADHAPAESFERLFVERTEEQIQECLDELESAASVRVDLRYNLRVPIRNVGQGCSWCSCMPECYGIELDILPEDGTLDF